MDSHIYEPTFTTMHGHDNHVQCCLMTLFIWVPLQCHYNDPNPFVWVGTMAWYLMSPIQKPN
jgi:hypothetical protein